MARWFTADLHLGHRNIIRYCNRPFASVEEMDDALIARWNELVAPADEVWVLGDVALGQIDLTLPRIGECHGVKHLVAGNHDRCWGGHRRVRPADVGRYTALFATVQDEAELELAGTPVRLHHFPYRGDHTDEVRHADRRPVDDGAWLLHGHIHELRVQDGRQINVGVDVWDYRPVGERILVDLIRAGPGRPADGPGPREAGSGQGRSADPPTPRPAG